MSETAGAEAAPVQSQTPGTDQTLGSGQGTETPTNTSFAAQTPPPEGDTPPGEAPKPDAASEPKADAAPEGDKPPEADAAPEPPDYSGIKLPEGFAEDDPLITKFLDTAKEKGVVSDAAQAVIDSLAPEIKAAFEAPFKEWQKMQSEWVDQIRADPEIGGENVRKVQATIGRMLDNPVFCDPDLRRVMDYTGAGNNPAFVRSFYRMALALAEGGPIATGRPAVPPKSAAETLYPSMNKGN